MVGYTEALTDCSFKGQILCQTYPLMGNYGICSGEFESDGPKVEGYVAYECCANPSHYTSESSLSDWLRKNGVPGIQGIDTRQLTKTLRQHGTMMGVLQVSEGPIDAEKLLEDLEKAKEPSAGDLVDDVTIEKPIIYKGVGKRVVIIDCGAKLGIVRALMKRDVEVIRVPAKYSAEKIMDFDPDGIVISNGPGDPKRVGYLINSVRDLLEYRVPVMGICLGNQILGLSLGLDTYKLKFGHRGLNHPVMDSVTKKCYITSQNHGYALNPGTMDDKKAFVKFTNVNDGTVEGIEHRKLPAFGVQFHPEASPGPVETKFLFEKFMKSMGKMHAKR